jgi:hypothetical protein
MNGHRYDTYGWLVADIDNVARDIEQVLSIQLEPRDSLYRGEYYAWDGDAGADLVLQPNFIEDDGLRVDHEYPDHLVLLYASELPEEWFDRLAKLPGVERLESTVLP